MSNSRQGKGPRRVCPAGIALEELPIHGDAVLLSHNHYDHMDIATLNWLHERLPCPFILDWEIVIICLNILQYMNWTGGINSVGRFAIGVYPSATWLRTRFP